MSAAYLLDSAGCMLYSGEVHLENERYNGEVLRFVSFIIDPMVARNNVVALSRIDTTTTTKVNHPKLQ